MPIPYQPFDKRCIFRSLGSYKPLSVSALTSKDMTAAGGRVVTVPVWQNTLPKNQCPSHNAGFTFQITLMEFDFSLLGYDDLTKQPGIIQSFKRPIEYIKPAGHDVPEKVLPIQAHIWINRGHFNFLRPPEATEGPEFDKWCEHVKVNRAETVAHELLHAEEFFQKFHLVDEELGIAGALSEPAPEDVADLLCSYVTIDKFLREQEKLEHIHIANDAEFRAYANNELSTPYFKKWRKSYSVGRDVVMERASIYLRKPLHAGYKVYTEAAIYGAGVEINAFADLDCPKVREAYVSSFHESIRRDRWFDSYIDAELYLWFAWLYFNDGG